MDRNTTSDLPNSYFPATGISRLSDKSSRDHTETNRSIQAKTAYYVVIRRDFPAPKGQSGFLRVREDDL